MSVEDWLATRPTCVQELAQEFPPGQVSLNVTDANDEVQTWYLIGYAEGDELIFSTVHPREWIDAHDEIPDEHKRIICAQHLRETRRCH